MSGPFIATFDKRVRDALRILPSGFDRKEVEKSVAALLYREARHLRRPSFIYRPPINERERKAIKRVANAHHRLRYALRHPDVLEFCRKWFSTLPELEKRQSKLEALTSPLKPRRNARIKRWAAEEAAYLMSLAKLPLTSSPNSKFVLLAEALSGQRGGFRHHAADYLRTEDT
jgi:hypothetical protein